MKVKKLINSVCSIALLFTTMASNLVGIQAVEENTNLLASYNFNANVLDQSGNGRDGILHGDITYVEGITGGENKAVRIKNGIKANKKVKADQYIDLGDSIFSTDDYSIAFWYKQNGADTSAGSGIIANKDYDSGANLGFAIGGFQNGIRLNFNAGGSRKDAGPLANATDKNWHHVVVTYNRQGVMTGYVDGEKLSSISIADQKGKSIDVQGKHLVIGADGIFQYGVSDMSVDDVSIHGKVLEQVEIDALFDVYKDILYPEEDVQAKELLHVDFNDNVKDLSGNEHHGIATGATYVRGIGGGDNKALSIHNDDHRAEGGKNPTSYVDFGNRITFDKKDFSLSFWWKDDRSPTISGDSGGTIIGNKNYDSGSNHGFALGSFTNDIRVNFNASTSRKEYRINSLADKNWHHIAITYDRDGNMTTYIDTKKAGSISIADQANASIDDLKLVLGADGKLQNGLSGGFYDELYVYQGLLGMEDIQQQYARFANNLEEDASIALREELSEQITLCEALLLHGEGSGYDKKDLSVFENQIRDILDSDIHDFTLVQLQEGIVVLNKEVQVLEEKKLFRDMLAEAKHAYGQEEASDLKKEKLKKAIEEAEKFDLTKADISAIAREKNKVNKALQVFRSKDEQKLSFAILSDTHIGSGGDTNTNYLLDAMNDLKKNEPLVQTIMISGDITQNGTIAEYANLKKTMEDNWFQDGNKLVATQGNHDVRWLCGSVNNGPDASSSNCGIGDNFLTRYLPFKNAYMDTDEASTTQSKPYYDTWIDGYHFISLNTEKDLKDRAYLSDEQLLWFDQALANKAEANKPIFITLHQPLNDTHARSTYWSVGEQDEKLKAILKKYPQAILVSGHVHNGIGIAGAVNNGYGTMLDAPSLAQNENGLNQKQIGYIVNVYEDRTQVRVYDFKNNTYLDAYEMNIDASMEKPTDDTQDLSTNNQQAIATSQEGDKQVSNILDHDTTTYWQSKGSVQNTAITIDLGGKKIVNGLRYLPYQNYKTDGSGGWGGHAIPGIIDQHKIEISDDNGLHWQSAEESTWQTNNYWKRAQFKPVKATHVRISATGVPAYNASNFVTAAELRIIGAEIDVDAFEEVIADAQKISSDLYTIDSYQHLQDAIRFAQQLFDKEDIATRDFEQALETLDKATGNLKRRASKQIVQSLQLELDKYVAKDKDDYTIESWQAYEQTYNEACARMLIADNQEEENFQRVIDDMQAKEALLRIARKEHTTIFGTGIQATGNLPKDATLQLYKKDTSQTVEVLRKIVKMNPSFLKLYAIQDMYQVQVYQYDEVWSVNGMLDITMELPATYRDKDFELSSIDEVGNVTILKIKREGDKISFALKDTETFAFVSKIETEVEDNTEKPDNGNDSENNNSNNNSNNQENLPDSNDATSPNTSDTTNFGIYVMLLIGSVFVLVYMKKKLVEK